MPDVLSEHVSVHGRTRFCKCIKAQNAESVTTLNLKDPSLKGLRGLKGMGVGFRL